VSEVLAGTDTDHELWATLGSPWWAYAAIVVPTGAVLVGTHLMAPALRPYLYHEGGIIENWSATLALFATLLGAWACWTSPDPRVARRYGAIPLLTTVLFADEISDGIWDEAPQLWGMKAGSLHDFVHIAYDSWRALESLWLTLAPLALAVLIAVRFGPHFRALGRFLAGDLSYRLVGVAAALGAVALVLDRDPGDTITFWEEWLEMNGALALFFSAALVPATLHQKPRAQLVGLAHSRSFRRAFCACLAVATLCGVLLV
jgi:hypothetical protein